jgi:outer membrane lipoprotein carrier protein
MKKNVFLLGVAPLLLALAACGGREGSAAEADGARDGAPAAEAPANGYVPGGNAPTSSDGEPVPPAFDEGQTGDGQAGDGVSVVPTAGGAAPGEASSGVSPAVPQPASPAASDRAAEILSRAERTAEGVRTLEADFTQSLTIPLLNQTQRGSGKLYQRKPDRFLMRFSDPAGDVMVADGRHFWLYYPSSDPRQVIRTSIAQGGEVVDFQRQFLSNPNARFAATLDGEEQVAGRAAYALTLVPRQASPYKVLRIWVDKQDHMVRRFEITEQNDSVRRVELRNLRTNHALSDGLFTFTPPAGSQVFDQ